MSLEQLLTDAAGKAVETLYGTAPNSKQLQIQSTRKDFEGDRTLVVFPLVRLAKKSPEATGEEIGQWLVDNVAEVRAFNVVKGFLNLSIGDAYWVGQLNAALEANNFGCAAPVSYTHLTLPTTSRV